MSALEALALRYGIQRKEEPAQTRIQDFFQKAAKSAPPSAEEVAELKRQRAADMAAAEALQLEAPPKRLRPISTKTGTKHRINLLDLVDDLNADDLEPSTSAQHKGRHNWSTTLKELAVEYHVCRVAALKKKSDAGWTDTVKDLKRQFGTQYEKLSVQTLKNWVLAAGKPGNSDGASHGGSMTQLSAATNEAINEKILALVKLCAAVRSNYLRHAAPCLHLAPCIACLLTDSPTTARPSRCSRMPAVRA